MTLHCSGLKLLSFISHNNFNYQEEVVVRAEYHFLIHLEMQLLQLTSFNLG